MKKRLFIALGALLFGNLAILPAQADDCVGPDCEVVFSFTGAPVTFNVPAGVNSIDFEVVAASGGDGGLGGKVTGTLQNLPNQLIITVGGAGTVGPEAPGGYNGGGKAGGFAGNEGSGGGASDIRLGADLASRIVVAGGGGGIGGRIGGFGGAGGGFTGETGGSGQGSGGRGGSHLMGGSGGYSNGGTAAGRGVLGLGGAGGSATYSGGGGGGGGYFGGGGGGADNATCCTDGGGGGGGSSYTNPDYVSDYSHTQGANQGNGYIKLSYTRQVELISFTGAQQDANSLRFELALSFSVPLSLSEFNTDQLGCGPGSISETTNGYQLSFTGCQNGTQTLILPANALAPGVPQSDVASVVAFDASPPSFSWQPGQIAIDNQSVDIAYNLDDDQLAAEDFVVVGCDAVLIETGNLRFTGCTEAQASITLLAGTLSDSWGNLAPERDLVQTFEFDRTGPEISQFSFLSDDLSADHSLQIDFSEPVQFDVSAIAAAASCSFTSAVTETSLTILGNCGYEPGGYLIPAGSLVDGWGNAGPTTDFHYQFQLVDPTPPVVYEPEPEPEPIAEPDPTPEPDQTGAESTPAPEQQPEVAPETPAETTDPVVPEEEVVEEITTEQPETPEETSPTETDAPSLPEEDSSLPAANTADVVREEEDLAAEPEPESEADGQPTADVIREPENPEPDQDSNPEPESTPEGEPGRLEEPVAEEEPTPLPDAADDTESSEPEPEPEPEIEPEPEPEPIAQPALDAEQEVGAEQLPEEVTPETSDSDVEVEVTDSEISFADDGNQEVQEMVVTESAEVAVLDLAQAEQPEGQEETAAQIDLQSTEAGELGSANQDSIELQLLSADLPESENDDQFPVLPLALFGLGAVAGATFLGYRFSGR